MGIRAHINAAGAMEVGISKPYRGSSTPLVELTAQGKSSRKFLFGLAYYPNP